MKSIMSELASVKAKKNVVTSIEYDCTDAQKENEIFQVVQDILFDHLEEFSKITYDIDTNEHKVKVEFSQHL